METRQVKRRPNFLWITLEDCSPRFGCYGDPVARTPNIDRLAAKGAIFQQAFCSAPVCSPSRTSVITGFHATAMGAQHMRTTYMAEEFPELPTPYHAVPPPYVKCFTEDLRVAGYYCCNNGKTDYQFPAPFSAWDANQRASTLAEIHWRNRPSPDQPFFAVFNLEDTHESRMWPGSTPAFEGDHRPSNPTDPSTVAIPPFLPDTPAVRQAIALHYDNIAHNDFLVGCLLDQLQEDGLAEDTIVMLWADHGDGLPRAKRFLHDSGLRIPLIIRAPEKFAPSTHDHRLTSLLDLAPTVLDWAGLPLPCHMAGHSLAGEQGQHYVFAYRDRLDGDYGTSRSARSERFKYIRNYYPGFERFGYIPYRSQHPAMQAIRTEQWNGNDSFNPLVLADELYDLTKDPHEMANKALSPEYIDVLIEHRQALDAWQSRHDPDIRHSEVELVRRICPAGADLSTAVPVAVIYHADSPKGNLVKAPATIERGPVLLQLACATEGASLCYRQGESCTWIPYRHPIRLGPGRHQIALRAVRYGYSESDIHHVELTIQG